MNSSDSGAPLGEPAVRDIAAPNGPSSFEAFTAFSHFFCDLFSQPGLLADAHCRDSYKEYVPGYYRKIFGRNVDPGSARHLIWYRRLRPLLSMPRGSRILDYGGGYGLDTIFLASLGYEMVFYEITPHHIGVAQWFADRFSERFGPLRIEFVLAGKDAEPRNVDAVMANEVAHHIEPAQRVFNDASAMVRPGGRLFLLEPNFYSPVTQAFFFRVRGFQTVAVRVNDETGEQYLWGNEHIRPAAAWNRLADAAGFRLRHLDYVVPWFVSHHSGNMAEYHTTLERLPIVRSLLASHLTFDYQKQ